MNFANWLMEKNYPYVEEAEKYEIGQHITEDEAWDMRDILLRCYLDGLDMSKHKDNGRFEMFKNHFSCYYVLFFGELVELMEAADDEWLTTFCRTFDVVDAYEYHCIEKDRMAQEEADLRDAMADQAELDELSKIIWTV